MTLASSALALRRRSRITARQAISLARGIGLDVTHSGDTTEFHFSNIPEIPNLHLDVMRNGSSLPVSPGDAFCCVSDSNICPSPPCTWTPSVTGLSAGDTVRIRLVDTATDPANNETIDERDVSQAVADAIQAGGGESGGGGGGGSGVEPRREGSLAFTRAPFDVPNNVQVGDSFTAAIEIGCTGIGPATCPTETFTVTFDGQTVHSEQVAGLEVQDTETKRVTITPRSSGEKTLQFSLGQQVESRTVVVEGDGGGTPTPVEPEPEPLPGPQPGPEPGPAPEPAPSDGGLGEAAVGAAGLGTIILLLFVLRLLG